MRRPEVELVPHAPSPEELFGDVSDHPYTLWLDSADRGPGTGRFSFLAFDPFLTLSSRGVWAATARVFRPRASGTDRGRPPEAT